MKGKSTKSALLMSFTSLLLCFAMLIGCTFAWFTDSVTSGVNKIQAGNLDIEVSYKNDNDTTSGWKPLEGSDTVFSKGLWEPGHTEFVTLKVENLGSLALKYQMNVSPINEKGGINVKGNSFKLSDYLVFGTTDPETKASDADRTIYTRATARSAVGETKGLTQTALTKNTDMAPGETDYITLVVYMPETVGNDANYKTGTTAPEIELSIKFIATQLGSDNDTNADGYVSYAEDDSFGKDYDEGVDYPTIDTVVTYNYFPQVSYVAQLKKADDTNKAVKDGVDDQVTQDADTITISSKEKADSTNSYAKVTFNNTDVETYDEHGKAAVELKAEKVDEGNIAAEIVGNQGEREYITYDVNVAATTGTMKNDTLYTVELFIGAGKQSVSLTHKGTTDVLMTPVDTLGSVADTFMYNPATGYVTMLVNHFSEFTAAYNAPVAAVGTTAYYSVESAVEAAKATGTGEAETVALIRDVKEKVEVEDIKLNLNGKTITDLTVKGAAVIDDGAKGGKIDKLTIAGNGTAVLPDGAVDAGNIEGDKSKIGFTGDSADSECVAAIGEIKYLTMQSAVKAAGTQPSTIQLLRDASGDGVDVEENQNITFDFNGYTYTLQGQMVGSSGTKTNGFRFLKGSTVTMKNGKLANGTTTADGNTPAKAMINSYTGLTLKDFSVDARTTANAPSGSPYGLGCLYISNGPAVVTGSGTYTGDPDGYVIYMSNVEYYTEGAALIFDENFTGSVRGKVTSGNKQAASIQIKNGTYGLDMTEYTTGTISITGGTFSSNPEAKYIADGFNAVDNGNDTWTVRSMYFAGGSGTADDPYQVATAEQFANIGQASGTSAYIALAADVDLTDAETEPSDYYPNYFQTAVGGLDNVVIDGQGHTVTPGEMDAVFGKVTNCTIKNLTVNYLGKDQSLCVQAVDTTFSVVTTGGLVTMSGNCGVICFYPNNVTLDKCVNNAELTGTGYNGIFLGYMQGNCTLNDCVNNADASCEYMSLIIGNMGYGEKTLTVNNFRNNGKVRWTDTQYKESDLGGGTKVFNPVMAATTDKSNQLTVIYNGETNSGFNKYKNIIVGGTGSFIQGPADTGLQISRNDDATFTFTKSANANVDHYGFEISVATGLKNGAGSGRVGVSETIAVNGSDSYTTQLKNLGFMDGTVATGNLAGNDIINVGDVNYYMNADNNYVVHNNTVNATKVTVYAYDGDGRVLSSNSYEVVS